MLTADALPSNERSRAIVSFISNDSEIKLGYGVIKASLSEFIEFVEFTEFFERRGKMNGEFKRFEEIQAWQKARLATKRVYQVSKKVDFAKDLG